MSDSENAHLFQEAYTCPQSLYHVKTHVFKTDGDPLSKRNYGMLDDAFKDEFLKSFIFLKAEPLAKELSYHKSPP